MLRNLKLNSLQEKTAVGDHWTILHREGHPLINRAGERETFENVDSFFRIHPDISQILTDANCQMEFLFIGYWPQIRDSAQSGNWLSDMLSALLIARNGDGTACRLASVVMQLDDWLAYNPEPAVIDLV